MRHYSKVLIGVPDSPDDPQELTVEITCDACGTIEFRTHIAHPGTLARTLSDVVRGLGGDDGHSTKLQHFEGLDAAREHIDRTFPEWKADRIRKRSKEH